MRQGREAQPRAGIVDSRSVKTTGVGGPRGYDGGKQLDRRQRHSPIDTQGFVLRATVREANSAARDGIKLLLPEEATADRPSIRTQFPPSTHRWLDGGQNGAGRGKSWIEQARGWTVDIVKHPWRPCGACPPAHARVRAADAALQGLGACPTVPRGLRSARQPLPPPPTVPPAPHAAPPGGRPPAPSPGPERQSPPQYASMNLRSAPHDLS